jgi:hypothetical protein
MWAFPAARQLMSTAAAALLLAPASALGTEVEVQVPPDAPPPDLAKDGLHSDPALETGWVHTFVDRERLLRGPGAGTRQIGFSPSRRVAGPILRIRRDGGGALWARVGFGGGVRGWVPVTALRSVPGLQPLSPGLRHSLTRLSAKAGRRSSVIIRDRWGRTLFSTGTRRPLVLASVTKIFTVGAALDRLTTRRLVREILAPSNNAKAQALIEWVGRGSSSAGTRTAERYAAEKGSVVNLADGSGLDPRNRAAGQEVVDYLQAMRTHPRFRLLKRGLPILGKTGTLKQRLTGSATRGRVQAKTGTLFFPSASTLAGYVQPRRSTSGPNGELTFAMLMNGIPYPYGRSLQDKMLQQLITRR